MLPFLFRLARVDFRFLRHQLLNPIDDGIRIKARRNRDSQFIPHPLSRSGEVEEVSLNGEAVHERNFSPGRMSRIRPVAGFEQNRFQQPNLHHFASHSIDLNPVAHPDTVAPHQRKPSQERHDEILHRHRQPGARQPKDGCGLVGQSEDEQQDCDRAHRLCGKLEHRAQRLCSLVLRFEVAREALDHAIRQVHH